MSGHSRRFAPLSLGLAVAVAMVLVSSVVMAQMTRPAPTERPESSRATVNSVEGTVSKIEPAAGKVQVSSGLFGLFGRTLEVTPDTQIQVQGKQGSLAELREGDKVKASYEAKAGQNIARSIDVLPGEEPRKSSRPKMEGAPASSQPSGSTPQPKTQ
jgi:Cu/Ag efflux protein CusF